MRPQKKSKLRKTVFAVSCLCIFAVSALVLYQYTAADVQPVKTAAAKRAEANAGTVLVPDGQGNCHKYAFGNDTGKGSYQGTAACDTAPPQGSRAALPPALRGMQNNLRPE